MPKSMLLGGVAFAALATPMPAAAQTGYTPNAEEKEELRQWEDATWRSTTGHQGGGRGMPANGYTVSPTALGQGGSHEEVGGVLYKYRNARGNWAFYKQGKLTGSGTSELLFNKKGMIYGWLTPSTGGERIEYFACRLPGTSHSYSYYSGSWLWSRRASYARQGNGFTVTVEFQNVDTWGQTLDFAAMEASFTAADGKSAKADRITIADGTQATGARGMDACEVQAYTFHFPEVPFAGKQLTLRMGGKTVGDWTT
ncbi:MAG TPA: hypothetical protein VN029_13285, partial [Sphingomonas sp.]|nr:hypothetical protein [Sphingomonas sp.]